MSELAISGKIKQFKDVQTGVAKSSGNPWSSQEFIVANNDGYEGKEQIFCFKVFGDDKVEQLTKFNKVGDDVKVMFNISVNEYNGNHYTSLNSWRVEKIGEVATSDSSEDDISDMPF